MKKLFLKISNWFSSLLKSIASFIVSINFWTIIVTSGLGVVSLHNFIVYNKIKDEVAKLDVALEAKDMATDTAVISDYFLNKLVKYRAPNPYVALAQFKIESGHFTSKLFRENNNPMGMKYPNRRPTTASKVHNGYAYYENLEDAVMDYILYSLYQTKGTLKDSDYIEAVLSSYAEDGEYKKKVTNLSTELKKHGDK